MVMSGFQPYRKDKWYIHDPEGQIEDWKWTAILTTKSSNANNSVAKNSEQSEDKDF